MADQTVEPPCLWWLGIGVGLWVGLGPAIQFILSLTRWLGMEKGIACTHLSFPALCSPSTQRPLGLTQHTDSPPPHFPRVFSFLGYLGWKKSPPPLLFSLIPQMKFQHMSPDIIPRRLWITFPQTMSSTADSSSPKCLPKRLGPLLQALSLPWANKEYL